MIFFYKLKKKKKCHHLPFFKIFTMYRNDECVYGGGDKTPQNISAKFSKKK